MENSINGISKIEIHLFFEKLLNRKLMLLICQPNQTLNDYVL